MTIWQYGAIAIAIWAFTAGAAFGAIVTYGYLRSPARPLRRWHRRNWIARSRIRAAEITDTLLLRNRHSRRTR